MIAATVASPVSVVIRNIQPTSANCAARARPCTKPSAATAVVKAMKDGEPSIGIRSEKETLVIGVWMMQPGEDKIVARRLRQVLEKRA